MVKKITSDQEPRIGRKMNSQKLDFVIYGLGLILILGFGCLILARPSVMAQRAVKAAVKKAPAEHPQTAGTSQSNPVPTPVAPAATLDSTPPPVFSQSTSAVDQSQVSVATPQSVSDPTPPPAPKKTATVIIDGLGTYTTETKDGDTALDMLRNVAASNGFVVTTVAYSSGDFVDSIGGRAGDLTHYWSFYCPDSDPKSLHGDDGSCNVGAGDHGLVINNGDVTEWRYASWGY